MKAGGSDISFTTNSRIFLIVSSMATHTQCQKIFPLPLIIHPRYQRPLNIPPLSFHPQFSAKLTLFRASILQPHPLMNCLVSDIISLPKRTFLAPFLCRRVFFSVLKSIPIAFQCNQFRFHLRTRHCLTSSYANISTSLFCEFHSLTV